MNTSPPKKSTLLVAWCVVILASSLPKVILQEIFGKTVTADQQAVMSLSVILAAFLATLIWRSLRGLWPLLGLFTVLIGSQWLVYSRIDELSKYPIWLHHPSFNVSMLAEESLNIMVTLLVIVALLLMGKKPKDFYLAKGDIAAPAEPIRWLGVKEGDRWNKFGIWLSVFISLGTLTFLVIGGRPPLDIVIRELPFLPAILLAAALNAFTEEITYKASFLSVLESPLGKRQAVYMVAVYFGLMHYYGIPYGVIGVLLAAFMGWLLAKSMQETGGLFWAWFIHFLQDVWIFAFLAIGSIIPGGG
jgi:membrane protease YdiL (CAAX protease family)